jgi:hypothetical protein
MRMPLRARDVWRRGVDTAGLRSAGSCLTRKHEETREPPREAGRRNAWNLEAIRTIDQHGGSTLAVRHHVGGRPRDVLHLF